MIFSPITSIYIFDVYYDDYYYWGIYIISHADFSVTLFWERADARWWRRHATLSRHARYAM